MFKPRKRTFPLPTSPLKIYEAPDIVSDPKLSIIDWSPQCNPFVQNSKLALGLQDQVFLIDHLTGKNSIIASLAQDQPGKIVCSINFDRSGEALAVGTSDRLVNIYDVERQQQVRKIAGSHFRVSALSWNKSILAPYLVSVSGPDAIIVNHDVRMRRSMVNVLEKHGCEVVSLNWSPNCSYQQMRQSDASSIFLASTSVSGDLAVWRLSDLSYGLDQNLQPYLYESENFTSPIKATAWNPNNEGVLAVGGGEGD